jgi:Cu/Ag efflux pump CusA
MSLGGLAIAIGEVVDDAIIDVENIVRRLRENEAAGRPRSPPSVVLAASLEVRRTVVYATLAAALVFLPLLLLSGLGGRFLAPLALSYLLAVFASLAVALTVTPALTLLAWGERPVAPEAPRLQLRAKAVYRRLLEGLLLRPGRLVGVLGALGLAALVLTRFLGAEFLPDFREGHLVLQVAAAPGASLDEMLRIGRRISQELLALPAIESVEQQVGRAQQGEDTWGPNRSEFHVELRPGSDDARTLDEVRALLAGTPGIQSEVLTFLGDRISETISGETSEVAINVFGSDLDVLEARAEEIARVLRETPGAVDVGVGERAEAPHLFLRLRSEALRRYGVRRADVMDTLGAALAGLVVAQVHRSGWPLDVVVRLEETSTNDPSQVSQLLVRGPNGVATPLGELADLEIEDARDVILHEGGQRRQTVTCNVSGRDVTSFVAAIKQRVAADVELPRGYYYTVSGTASARAEAQHELLFRAGLGASGVVLLLSWVAYRGRNLALLLLNLPLALLGGVLSVAGAALLRGEAPTLSLGGLVGFVTLFGVTTRNAIMMMSQFQRLVEEGKAWTPQTAIRGASDRLVPILMTALVTGLGLLPVALFADRPGGEIDGPMATVILGGLVTSTALNLLVLPLLCIHFGRFEPRAAAQP